jgi:hypothetical protein
LILEIDVELTSVDPIAAAAPVGTLHSGRNYTRNAEKLKPRWEHLPYRRRER